MKFRSLIILLLVTVVAMYLALREDAAPSPLLDRQECLATPPLPLPEPTPPVAAPTPALRPKEVIPQSTPVRLHWHLKLPSSHDLKPGVFAFRDTEAFAGFLGSKNQCFVRWNNVDFKKQMAIVCVSVNGSPQTYEVIDSIVQNPSEIVVFIKHASREGVFPQVVTSNCDGVVINRCDLPLRFSYFDEVVPQSHAAQ